ncbi:hypothetical protein RNJ44_03601 [Nakaseomyces bracarensis]|uniref:Uncharacterized protein n=1 Tax=Nakaseomyces bracarensis TaxID=273131 RepID=A0ABR4NXF4_9SACH
METKRRRGRPQLTKDYADPLQSPMAHSSMQVQRQGKKSFAKPMMKVVATPSPKKRRMSNVDVQSPSVTKKGRHRGTILSSPMKRGEESMSSTPVSTPNSHSSMYFSVSRNTLQSSPPMMFSSPMPGKVPTVQRGYIEMSGGKNLKLALTVNEKGEAVISGAGKTDETASDASSALKKMRFTAESFGRSNAVASSETNDLSIDSSTNFSDGVSNVNIANVNNVITGSVTSDVTRDISSEESQVKDTKLSGNPTMSKVNQKTFDKKEVLTLLKKMNFNAQNKSKPNATCTTAPSENEVKPRLELEQNDNLPKISLNGQDPKSPCTPRSTFQFKTGFTPKFGIDSVLADEFTSPRFAKRLASHENQTSVNISSPEHNLTLTPKSRRNLRALEGFPFNQFLAPNFQQSQEKQLTRTPITTVDSSDSQYVFKFSGGDPLLITEDSDGNWPDVVYHQFSSSPRKSKVFNTPPSWINFGSPGPLSPLRRNSTTIQGASTIMKTIGSPNISNERGTSAMIGGHLESGGNPIPHEPLNIPKHRIESLDYSPHKMTIPSSPRNIAVLNEPTTPRGEEPTITTNIQCTPLIQHTMDGSLSSKYIPTALAIGSLDSSVAIETTKRSSISLKQDDARAALQRLINDQ